MTGGRAPAVAFALLVVGTLLGPVYSLYCEKASGRVATIFELTERATQWTLPDGSTRHIQGGQAYRPVVLKLSPDMNRVRLKLIFDAAPGRADAQVGRSPHRAELLDTARPLLDRSLPLMLLPGEEYELTAGTVEIEHPGEYIFLLSEESPPRVTVSRVTLQVLEGFVKPIAAVVWGGRLAMLTGAVWLLYIIWRLGR
jgi:hypothetical protein